MPIKRRPSCCPAVFSPNQRTSPLLGRISAAIARSKVVLPAPFDPVRTMLSPAATCRSISSSTRRRPNRLVTRRTSMAMRGSVMVHACLSSVCSKLARCGRGITAWAERRGRSSDARRCRSGQHGNHDAGQPDPSAHPEPADQRVIDQRQVDLLGLAAAMHDDVEVAAEGRMDRDLRAPLVLGAIENLGGLKRIARPARLVDFKLGGDDDLLAEILVGASRRSGSCGLRTRRSGRGSWRDRSRGFPATSRRCRPPCSRSRGG